MLLNDHRIEYIKHASQDFLQLQTLSMLPKRKKYISAEIDIKI